MKNLHLCWLSVLGSCVTFLQADPQILHLKSSTAASSSLDKGFIVDGLPLNAVNDDAVSVSEQEQPSDVDMNFANVSLASVVEVLAQRKSLNLLVDKSLGDVKVSLKMAEPTTLDKAWNTILTLLDVHGFTHVRVGKIDKIIPTSQAGAEALPVYSSAKGVEPEDLEESDKMIRYIYYLKNIKVDTALNILNTLLPEKPQLVGDLEMCVIKGKSSNIKFAFQIIKELDVGGLRQSLSILELQYAEPEFVVRQLEDVIGTKGSQDRIRYVNPGKKSVHYFSQDVKIIPNNERRMLILLGQQNEIERITHFIKLMYDRNTVRQAKSRVHQKEIKYHDPNELARTLERLKKNATTAGGQPYFKDVLIMPESARSSAGTNFASGNRLIIACNPDDWVRIESLIDRIDKPQPQVALEIMIIDATSDLDRKLEAHIRDTGYGIFGDSFSWRVNNYASSLTLTPEGGNISPRENPLGINLGEEEATGVNWVTLGSTPEGSTETGAWAFIKALIKQDNSTIIAQPFLITNNNQEARFNDTDRLKVFGRFSSSSSRITRQEDYEDASNSVSVTPRINSDGIVDLDINIRASDFISRDKATSIKNDRSLKTRATMALGEVLILGGLTRSKLENTEYKVPLIGDIPVLGTLFRGRSKKSTKTKLYVFIRPSVIKPRLHSEPDDYTALKLKYAKYQIQNVNTYAKSKDPVEHFYFKPRSHTIQETLQAHKENRFSYIDEFAERKHTPVAADLIHDPYFRHEDLDKGDKEPELLANGSEIINGAASTALASAGAPAKLDLERRISA